MFTKARHESIFAVGSPRSEFMQSKGTMWIHSSLPISSALLPLLLQRIIQKFKMNYYGEKGAENIF